MAITSIPIASLPMYDFPHLKEAHSALWQYIADKINQSGLAHAPTTLTDVQNLQELWQSPNLLLSQTCGYPLVTLLQDKVQIICTPKYSAPGCIGASHRSFVVIRKDDQAKGLADLRGRRAAVNSVDSNSGFNAFRAMIAKIAEGKTFFEKVMFTNAHATSIDTVIAGDADVAAIDCITYALIDKVKPEITNRLRVLTESDLYPCLPYVTAKSTKPELVSLLRTILLDINQCAQLKETLSALMLEGFAFLPPDAYDTISRLEQESFALEYPTLA